MKIGSIKKNAIINVIYTISNIAFPLLTFPYVSRILLAEGLGKVSLFSSIANYAILFASLGISTYGIRATARVRENEQELSQVTAELLSINLISTIIVLLVFACVIPFVDRLNREPELLIINGVLVLSSTLSMSWLYSGLEQYSYIAKRSIALKTVSAILIFIFVKDAFDYKKYAAIVAFSSIGSYLLNFLYSRNFVDLFKIQTLKWKRHLKPMLLLFASILAVSVYTELDTIMLGFLRDDTEVGLYSMAVKIKGVLLNCINAVSAVLLPRMSYYLSEHNVKDYNNVLKVSTALVFMFSIPMAALFILEARDSILIIGGESYLGAVLCMQTVMPILLISGFSNVLGNQVLIPQGLDACFMKAVLVGAAVDFGLNIILMPKYGCVGAAIATLIAEVLQMSIQFIYASKYIKTNIPLLTISKCFLSTLIASGVLYSISKRWCGDLYLRFFILAGIYGIVYCLMLIFMKDEILKRCIIGMMPWKRKGK